MADLNKDQKKQFAELKAEYDKLQRELDQTPITIAMDAAGLEALPGLISDAKKAVYDLEDSVEGLRGRWEGVVGEIKKSDDISKESFKSFSKLKDVAEKLQHHQRGSSELSSKELRSLVTRQKIEQENLKYQQAALQKKVDQKTATEDEKKALKEVNEQLKKEGGLVDATLKKTKELLKEQRNIEKATGLTGVAMKGMAAFTDKIGMGDMGNVFEDAAEAAKATASRLTDGGKKAGGFLTKVRSMGSAFKVVGKAILQNLTDPLVVAGMAIKGMKAVFSFFSSAYTEGEEAAMRISDENTNMARSLGLAQGAASKLAGSVAGMGPTVAASKASIEGIYSAMGSTEKLSTNTMKVFVKLNTQAGMSADSLVKLQKFSKLAGQDAGVMVKNMTNTALQAIKANKLAMSQKELLNETANQSSYIRVQFAKQPQELLKAVAASKALGINMEKTRDISRSLLNFEDSIAAEMEAELLTGKQLNFEEARALALKGDSLGAAKKVLEQMGGIEEFNKMNVIQQEALAAAAGMTVDQLTEQMDAAAGMKNENGDLVDAQQDGLKAMTSEVSAREAAENRARASAEANIAVYEKLKGLVHQLKETWTQIKTILMESLADALTPMIDYLQSEEGKKFLEELPDKIKDALKGVKEMIGTMRDFIKEHPDLVKWAVGIGAGVAVAVKSGVLKSAAGLFSGKIGVEQAAAKAAGVELGEPSNPMFVKIDGGGDIASDVMDMVGKNGRASFAKQMKTLFKKPSVMFRALAMKGGRFGRIIGKLGMKFGGLISKVGGLFKPLKNLASGLGKAVSKLGSFIKGLGSKLASGAKSLWSSIKGGAKKLVGGAKNLVSKAAGGVKSLGSKAWGGIKSMGSKAWSGIKSAGNAAWSGVKKVASAVNPVKALKSGVISKAGKFIGKAVKGGLLGALLNAGSLAMILAGDGTPMDKAKAIIPLGASILGGALGSVAGSIIPVVGTFLGGLAGSYLGDWIGNLPAVQKALAPPLAKALGGEDVAEDFIMQGGKIQKFRKDDIVMGGTNLMGGDPKMVALLERLVSAVEKGGTVVLDGQKVGNALVAGSYKMQ